MAKKKKTKQDKNLQKIGYGFGIAGGVLLSWYGVNRYKIWLDNRKVNNIAGGGSTPVIPVYTNIVCKGDTNANVRILQNYLKYIKGQSFPRFGVDGDWGTETTTAVTNIYGAAKTCFTKAEIDMMADAYRLGGF